MKLFLISTYICLFHSLSAQVSTSWDGNFNGHILGITSNLAAQKEGTSWTANIDANGYLFYLTGTLDNMRCTGTMTNAQDQTSVPFVAVLTGSQLALRIHDNNPTTGLKEDMEFVFTKYAADNSGTNQPDKPLEKVDKTKLDQNLIGNWRYTESYVSGEFSFATDWHMQINSDGSFAYGEGRIAGGGPNSSVDSGAGKVERGHWKSENKVIWLNDGSGWVAYARYYRENGNLMFTFGNGKSQVWEKI